MKKWDRAWPQSSPLFTLMAALKSSLSRLVRAPGGAGDFTWTRLRPLSTVTGPCRPVFWWRVCLICPGHSSSRLLAVCARALRHQFHAIKELPLMGTLANELSASSPISLRAPTTPRLAFYQNSLALVALFPPRRKIPDSLRVLPNVTHVRFWSLLHFKQFGWMVSGEGIAQRCDEECEPLSVRSC